jgi:PKHD-type hydroxylase
MILEIELLQDYEILTIQNLLSTAAYKPGKLSTGENTDVKVSAVVDQNTLEYKKVYEILSRAISNNITFSSLLSTKKITPPVIVNYETGGFYDWHIDEIEIGSVLTHYSMTIFLNNPDEYGGGELILIRDGKEEQYKLQAGKALIYSTGMLHKVAPVKTGNRLVSVSWLESLIKDEFVRNCIFNLGKINKELLNDKVDSNKVLSLEQLRINMLRQYGNF